MPDTSLKKTLSQIFQKRIYHNKLITRICPISKMFQQKRDGSKKEKKQISRRSIRIFLTKYIIKKKIAVGINNYDLCTKFVDLGFWKICLRTVI